MRRITSILFITILLSVSGCTTQHIASLEMERNTLIEQLQTNQDMTAQERAAHNQALATKDSQIAQAKAAHSEHIVAMAMDMIPDGPWKPLVGMALVGGAAWWRQGRTMKSMVRGINMGRTGDTVNLSKVKMSAAAEKAVDKITANDEDSGHSVSPG